MLDARRRNRAGLTESSGRYATGVGSRLRVFALLALLVPVFAGLHYLALETAPRVEVRVATQEPAVLDSVSAQPERVVERVVYVPVAKSETAPLIDTASALPVAEGRADATSGPAFGGHDSTIAARVEAVPEQMNGTQVAAVPASAADSADAPTPHMGLLAVATPVSVPALTPALVIAAAPVVRVVAPPPVLEPVDDDAAVADADAPDEDAVGEAVADEPADADGDQQEVAQIQVIDTTIEADQSTRVISYRIPVQPKAAPGAPASVDAPSTDDPIVADAPGEPPADEADIAEADVADAGSADDDVAKAADEGDGIEAKSEQTDGAEDADVDEVMAIAPGKDDADEQAPDDAVGDDAVAEADPADASDDSPTDVDAQEIPQLSVTVLATTSSGIAIEAVPGQ